MRSGVRASFEFLSMSTLDLFAKSFVLLLFGKNPPSPEAFEAAARQRGVPLSVVDVADPEIAKLYERRLVLVRPDGHVAWRADEMPADALRIIDTVRGA